MSNMKQKHYNQAYFEHWYRGQSIQQPAALARKVAVAVAITELHIGGPIRTVLDVGCGEALWRKPLLKLRPNLQYQGVDASEYVVQRYGKSRNIVLANFGQMQQLRIGPPVDLLICADVMHYIQSSELKRGLQGFTELCTGAAYLDVFCRNDKPTGDFNGFIARSAAQYRHLFQQAGFIALGSHCYLSAHHNNPASALEHL
jgi:predicted TPR repeat methyltransferase